MTTVHTGRRAAGSHAFSAASLEWLDRELASGEPAFVCLHHPPVDVHIDVVATLAGHAHSACAMTFAERSLLACAAIPVTAAGPLSGCARCTDLLAGRREPYS